MSKNMKLTLAISKIGDLLINNRITINSAGTSIDDIKLCIPDYQRPYKWSAKNALQLFDDIMEAKNANKEVYRVGTLILHEECGKYNIVDGQQRTITFSLLLKALDENSQLAFLREPLIKNPENIYNVPANFNALLRRVKNISDNKERTDFLEYIKNNCEIIVVITDDLSEAFQFFDSQNARGKKLYPHDLLKAYHLREMNDLDAEITEKAVKQWEDMDQKALSSLFSDYLYRLKEWVKGNKAWDLNEQNIQKFKGITRADNFSYAQFYKGAFAYADMINHSSMPFVSGMHNLKPFQIDTPIIAGKPFFDYAKHYFNILQDIQNNDKYSGYYINDNEIVKTLDLHRYKNGTGNRITRLLFDTAVLLYVDRFCPEKPDEKDLEMLNQFVIQAFIWAYSMRAQYYNVGWLTAQNYIMGNGLVNSFNIYKLIAEADSPVGLFGQLADKISPISMIAKNQERDWEHDCEKKSDGIPQNYLTFFERFNFLYGDKK